MRGIGDVHPRQLDALFWLMQSKDSLLYKTHYSREIKIIYHSFLQEPSVEATQLKAVQSSSVNSPTLGYINLQKNLTLHSVLSYYHRPLESK